MRYALRKELEAGGIDEETATVMIKLMPEEIEAKRHLALLNREIDP